MGTEVRTSSPFFSCHTVHVVAPLTPAVVTWDSPTKRSELVVVVSLKGISTVSVASPRVTRLTLIDSSPASPVVTFTRSRGCTETPAASRIARASCPGRAATSRVVPSTVTTTLRARDTSGVSSSRDEERSAARLTAEPSGAASARIASADEAVVHRVRVWPSTVTVYGLEVRTTIVSPSRTASPVPGWTRSLLPTLTPAACSASPTVLPQEVTGRDTPLTSSMTDVCEEATPTPAMPKTPADARAATPRTMRGEGAKERTWAPRTCRALAADALREVLRWWFTILHLLTIGTAGQLNVHARGRARLWPRPRAMSRQTRPSL